MSQWTTAYVDALPNSSFAWVDKDGNRHLPYKDKDGNVDHNHTADALARLDQVQGMPDSERATLKAKLEKALSQTKASANEEERFALTATAIKLDANGQLPTRLALFVTGDWPNSVKGDFSVSLDDLKQMKENFDKGIGFPTEDASTGLAIDFKHEYDDQAAAWIKGLELSIDPSDPTKGTLYANPVEWTDAGAEAVRNSRFKCVSPMGSFGRKNGKLSLWSNVNNLAEKIANVIEGAGLTNIPFLRGMPPIRASATPDENEDDIYLKINQNKEIRMNLDALRVKDKKELKEDELQHLKENEDKLSADERKKFGFILENETHDTLSAEDKDLLAAIKSGSKKVVDTMTLNKLDKLDALEATAEEYRKEKANQVVLSHIKRGALKPSEQEKTATMLLSLDGDTRKTFEDHLSALPSNDMLATEYGHKDDVKVTDVVEELDTKTKEHLKEAKSEGKMLTYGQAQTETLHANKDLSDRYNAYREQQNLTR